MSAQKNSDRVKISSEEVAKAHLETFDKVRPASTLIQVTSMLRPWQKVEIEAYAKVPDKLRRKFQTPRHCFASTVPQTKAQNGKRTVATFLFPHGMTAPGLLAALGQ